MFRAASQQASSMMMTPYRFEVGVVLRLGEEHPVGHEFDERVVAGFVGEADLVADGRARATPSFGDTRRDGPAAMRRGWVCPISRSAPGPGSGQILGSCVVFPEPVSPQTTTAWLSRLSAAISSRRCTTGSSVGYRMRAGVARARRSRSARDRSTAARTDSSAPGLCEPSRMERSSPRSRPESLTRSAPMQWGRAERRSASVRGALGSDAPGLSRRGCHAAWFAGGAGGAGGVGAAGVRASSRCAARSSSSGVCPAGRLAGLGSVGAQRRKVRHARPSPAITDSGHR